MKQIRRIVYVTKKMAVAIPYGIRIGVKLSASYIRTALELSLKDPITEQEIKEAREEEDRSISERLIENQKAGVYF